MINILIKDLKLFFGKEQSTIKWVTKFLFIVLFLVIVIGIEYYMFLTILNKISNIVNASAAFLTLFLTVVEVLVIFADTSRASKLFFNEKDIEQLSIRPVSNASIIMAKIIFLFLFHYAISILFIYPLFIAYGNILNRAPLFYYVALFYPVLTFFFEVGIALVLVYPFYLLIKFLKQHIIVRYIVALGLLFGITIIYSYILNVFVNALSESGINALLTTSKIEFVINLREYFLTSFLTSIFVENKALYFFPYIAIALGVFIFGLSIAIFSYNYVRNVAVNFKTKAKEHKYKVKSETIGLIKKELTMLTKNTDYTFSFIGLLIVEPFLAYFVVSSLNTIFKDGIFAYYISVVPNFFPLFDILVIMLFTMIIAAGANKYITMEKNTIKVIKTIPISIKKQLTIKVLIPFVFSLIALIVTMLVLLLTNAISVSTFSFGLLLCFILLVIYNLISLKEELSIRHAKPRSYFVSSLYAYLLPVIYFVITAFMSYFQISIYISYLVGILALVIIGIPEIIMLLVKYKNMFLDLDVTN